MSTTFKHVAFAILDERKFQNEKYGTIDDTPHELGTWVLLIEAELDEAKKALIKGGTGRNALRSELVQVAALCFAALEQHDLHSDDEGRAI